MKPIGILLTHKSEKVRKIAKQIVSLECSAQVRFCSGNIKEIRMKLPNKDKLTIRFTKEYGPYGKHQYCIRYEFRKSKGWTGWVNNSWIDTIEWLQFMLDDMRSENPRPRCFWNYKVRNIFGGTF